MILSWKQQQDYQETRYDTEALLIKPGLRSSENEWQCTREEVKQKGRRESNISRMTQQHFVRASFEVRDTRHLPTLLSLTSPYYGVCVRQPLLPSYQLLTVMTGIVLLVQGGITNFSDILFMKMTRIKYFVTFLNISFR